MESHVTMSNSHRVNARQAGCLIDNAVTDISSRGYTRGQAFDQAADFFGISPRRARDLAYGQIISLAVTEYQALVTRFQNHLEAEERHVADRLKVVRIRLREMETRRHDYQDRKVGDNESG